MSNIVKKDNVIYVYCDSLCLSHDCIEDILKQYQVDIDELLTKNVCEIQIETNVGYINIDLRIFDDIRYIEFDMEYYNNSGFIYICNDYVEDNDENILKAWKIFNDGFNNIKNLSLCLIYIEDKPNCIDTLQSENFNIVKIQNIAETLSSNTSPIKILLNSMLSCDNIDIYSNTIDK